MDDRQANKLNMYIKTSQFLINKAADLAGVTQIASISNELEKNIEDITKYEGDASADTTGYTMEKAQERLDLEKIMLKVSRACAAYFLSIGSTGKMKEADETKSEVEGLRGNDIFVRGNKLYDIAEPVKTFLTDFNSGPADVTALKDALAAFYQVLELPENKRGEKVASGKEVDSLFVQTDELLKGLDIYMYTFEAINALLYNQYLSARAIDDNGGGAQNTKTGNVPMNAATNIPFADGKINAGTVLNLTNRNTAGDLTFYFSDSPTAGPGTATDPQTISADTTTPFTALVLGFDITHTFLNVFNPNAVEGKWKAEIL